MLRNTSPPGQAPWTPGSGITRLLLALLRVTISVLAVVSPGGWAGWELAWFKPLLDDECSHSVLWSNVSCDTRISCFLGTGLSSCLLSTLAVVKEVACNSPYFLYFPAGCSCFCCKHWGFKSEVSGLTVLTVFFSPVGNCIVFYWGEWELCAVSAPDRTRRSLKKGAVWLGRKKCGGGSGAAGGFLTSLSPPDHQEHFLLFIAGWTFFTLVTKYIFIALKCVNVLLRNY